MPEMTVTTKASREVWKSPDGQRTISEVILDYNGTEFKGKTYSNAIAVEGFSGEVETYEKQGKQGVETFVKQKAKEGGYSGGGKSFSKDKDPFAMYLSYAKDIAIACVVNGAFANAMYAEMLEAVSAGGEQLFNNKPGATSDPVAEIMGETKKLDEPDPFDGIETVPMSM